MDAWTHDTLGTREEGEDYRRRGRVERREEVAGMARGYDDDGPWVPAVVKAEIGMLVRRREEV